MSSDDYVMKDHDDFMREKGRKEGREEGRAKGILEGRFLSAVSFKGSLSVERISEISGFSVEELKSEKLNGKLFEF